MNSLRLALGGLLAAIAITAWALDPPHDISNNINCINCHTPHGAAGGSITREAGNPNLCMTCHNPGGIAAPRPFADVDQALPGVGGSSHRWDSGPSGHVERQPGNTSPGTLRSGGAFSGRIENRYTITITATGDLGTAAYGWSDAQGNNGSGIAGNDVPLDRGLLLDFADGGTSPSFLAGDSWLLEVRVDLRLPDFGDPFERPMAQRLAGLVGLGGGVFDTTYARVVCSVCHDQHSQEHQPFDPSAPPFLGDGTGEGRFFQRRDNDFNQMCVVCHAARNVASSALGSHPVGVPIPGGEFRSPLALDLDPNAEVGCLTCHAPHYADSGGANGGNGDGYLLNQDIGNLCLDCHTLADHAGGSHFDSATGALWPGGQYGSSFAAHGADKRGFCINCHWPHGWADDDQPSGDYPRLWVEQYDVAADGSDPDDAEDLCYTCHDGAPAQSDIRADFLKGSNGAEIFHHPVMDSEQTPGRSVECVECHNPHRARADNRLAGVTGVDLAGSPVGPGTADPREPLQAEVCFKCHGDSYNNARILTSNKRLDFDTSDANSGYHPVTQPGRNQSANLAAQLLGGLTTASTLQCTDCHNSDATAASPGPVADSAALTQGAHGSSHATILRANFDKNYQGQGNWTNSRANLCFLCHDPNVLLPRRFDDGARTNFYQQNGRDNLHDYHLTDKSNRSAGNTEYRWRVNGQWFTSTTPPANVKTHLVSFAPDVEANNFAMPRWQINTETGVRSCDVSCHGRAMDDEPYQPPSGDEPSHTF